MDKSEEQQYKEWKDKSNSKWGNFTKQINPVYLYFIIIAFFVFYYFYSQGSINNILFIGGIVALIVVVIFLFGRKTDKTLIPEQIIKQIVQEAVQKKRFKGVEIPFDAEVRVRLESAAMYEQDMASQSSGFVKREVALEVIRKGHVKKFIVAVHPYTGEILDYLPRPLGVSTKDAFAKDKQIIPVNVFNDNSNTKL